MTTATGYLPEIYEQFRRDFPDVSAAYDGLGARCTMQVLWTRKRAASSSWQQRSERMPKAQFARTCAGHSTTASVGTRSSTPFC
jgi:hypothetical protein